MSKPATLHPPASSSCAIALPMPELDPVTIASMGLLRLDVGVLDDLHDLDRVFHLEFDEVVDRSRSEQQALLHELRLHVAVQRLVYFDVELVGDLLRHLRGAPQ